jgi:hypothetical protein
MIIKKLIKANGSCKEPRDDVLRPRIPAVLYRQEGTPQHKATFGQKTRSFEPQAN